MLYSAFVPGDTSPTMMQASQPVSKPVTALVPKPYIPFEIARNQANVPMFRAMIRMAYGRNDAVLIGHHLGFEVGDDYSTENEIPSADTLIFDHDIMRAVFGADAIRVMQALAALPVGPRDSKLREFFKARYPNIQV